MSPSPTTKPEQSTASNRRVRTMRGVVVRRSGDKTVSVNVTRVTRHPLYEKKIVRSKRYLVHDPEGRTEVGSTVVLIESRPRSKRKRWSIVSEASETSKTSETSD